jgi:hypothetical protein
MTNQPHNAGTEPAEPSKQAPPEPEFPAAVPIALIHCGCSGLGPNTKQGLMVLLIPGLIECGYCHMVYEVKIAGS